MSRMRTTFIRGGSIELPAPGPDRNDSVNVVGIDHEEHEEVIPISLQERVSFGGGIVHAGRLNYIIVQKPRN